MAERITVALSDETANLLNLYCDKRQMNKSSASAGLLVDGLENWLMQQRNIGRKMTEAKTPEHFNFSIFAGHGDLLKSSLNEELRLESSQLVVNDDTDESNKLLKFNLILAMHNLCNSIVPMKSFANNTYERLCTALYARLASSELAQHIYADGLSLTDKNDVDEQLRRVVPFDFNIAKDYHETIATQQQLGMLIMWRKTNIDIPQDVYNDIQDFFKEHSNGKIVVVGETGAGKTTFATELAQLFHCDLPDSELGEELRANDDFIDFFNQYTRSVGTMHGRDFNTVISHMKTIVQTGIKEKSDVDILKSAEAQDIYFVKVVREETNQSHGLQPIFKRYIERGMAKRVVLVGNAK